MTYFKATDDVDGVMSTPTEDAEHEVIPSPVLALATTRMHAQLTAGTT